MSTFAKRLSVLALLALIISGGRVYAQDGSQATAPAVNTNLPSAQPVIHGTVSTTQIVGIAGSYCWPQSDASTPECDVVDDPRPSISAPVNIGDGILFTTDPAAPGPASLKGLLLDDKNADGEQPSVDLTATGGTFTVENLNPGPHRLQVTAIYPGDVEGNQPFVTYVFMLVVSEAAAPTEAVAPTTEIVSTSPVEPTIEPTIEPTTEPTIEPTIEPTVAQATEQQPVATETVVEPTVEQPTPTSTEQPTTEPTLAQVTIEAIVASPAPTATPNTSSAGTNVTVPTINVPPATLIVNGRTFEPIAVNTCVQGQQGETVCINRPTNTTVQKVFAAGGDVAQISFGGPRPTSITVTQLTSDGSKTIGSQSLKGDNLVLYTLPAANGNFILDIQIVYPQGKVDYFFRLAIGS